MCDDEQQLLMCFLTLTVISLVSQSVQVAFLASSSMFVASMLGESFQVVSGRERRWLNTEAVGLIWWNDCILLRKRDLENLCSLKTVVKKLSVHPITTTDNHCHCGLPLCHFEDRWLLNYYIFIKDQQRTDP